MFHVKHLGQSVACSWVMRGDVVACSCRASCRASAHARVVLVSCFGSVLAQVLYCVLFNCVQFNFLQPN